MFIVVRFGYRLRKYFTIDCLTASLSDCIFKECMAFVLKTLEQKEVVFQKEIGERTKKTPVLEKSIETLDSKIKAAHPVSSVET